MSRFENLQVRLYHLVREGGPHTDVMNVACEHLPSSKRVFIVEMPYSFNKNLRIYSDSSTLIAVDGSSVQIFSRMRGRKFLCYCIPKDFEED